jgi:nucleoside-diphosphate-sugar epimerase
MSGVRRILLAGGLGVVGRALVEACQGAPGIALTLVGRRQPDVDSGAAFIACDLLDREAAHARLGALRGITDIVHCAYAPAASREAEVAPNLALLRNLVEPVAAACPGLRHVTLMQGAKAYGTHLGPFTTPAEEADARHMPPNFYYDQQDWLAEAAARGGWNWTAWRPPTVFGFSIGSPMNILNGIAVYAAISRELGLPLRFPGTPKAYGILAQAVDAALIARAILWSQAEPRAAGQVYNITNGDSFRWSRLWPRFARACGMEAGEPQPIPLAEFMAGKAALWQRIAERHALRPIPYASLVDWPFTERTLKREYDFIFATTKLRLHGFTEQLDTAAMFAAQVARLRGMRVIPP